MLRYDSITVSSAWELTSVSMRYSQGEVVNTSLSDYVVYPRLVQVLVFVLYNSVRRYVSFLCGLYDYFPWHGRVLSRMQVMKIMCGNQLYLQG